MARALAGKLSGSFPAGAAAVMATPASRTGKPVFIVRALRFLALLVLAIHAWYIVTTCLLILVYKAYDPPASVIMVYRAVLYGWKVEAPKPRSLKKIPVYIRSMLVSVEDGKFYTHHGLDFEAFKRARQINAIVGRPLYGGSTLTMQVARTLFLVPEKSYIRKYFEIITALELEAFLDKDRILELYFGYAEWGKGLFGIEPASLKYYKKTVAALNRDEAARLVALLSSPIKYNPSNLSRSGILRERYAYLSRRYTGGGAQLPDQATQFQPPPQGIEPSALDDEAPAQGGSGSTGDTGTAGNVGAVSGTGAEAASPGAANQVPAAQGEPTPGQDGAAGAAVPPSP